MKDLLEKTQTITSREKIKKIFDEFFMGKPAYLRVNDRDIRVKCYSCANGKLTAGIPFVKLLPDEVIIFTTIGKKTANFHLHKTGRAGVDITVFDVIKCTLIVPSRCCERYKVAHDRGNRKVIFITGFITDTMVENSIVSGNKKISSIFNYAETEMHKHFSSVKFQMKSDAVNDARMDYISKTNRGYVVKKLDEDNPGDREGYEFYINNILNIEKSAKKSNPAVSEALLPLYYKDKIPYGYLRVNNEAALNDSDLIFAGNFIKSLEHYILKMDVFPVIADKMIVNDISAKGMSILQHDRKNIRHFKTGNRLCCDLILPESRSVHLLSTVRHNTHHGEGVTKTGFEIEKIDDDLIDDYNAYIGSLA